MIFFKQAESTRLAGDVVASLLPLQEVPGDGEVGACPPQAVDVPAEGGARLLLVLLLHVIHVPIMSLPKRAASQACVGLCGVVVGSDGGLVHHPGGLALARHRAGWLVLAIAALKHWGGWSGLGNHFGVVFCQNLSHVGHCLVAHFDSVCVEGAPQNVARGEALSNDAHENLGNVGGAVLREGGIEPCDAALPVVPPPPHLLLLHHGLVGQLVVVSSCVQCCLVRWGRSIKQFLVRVSV